MSIKLLPESVWARIAAGEVVERPASAVKEMVENSLDAGSSRIKVRLWDGGRLRIVVEDDGCGIAFEELPLALTPHATSKISGIDDLEAINTLGYRGEALASLTAVAGVEIRSRPEGEAGGMIKSYDGQLEHVRASCSPGTRVQVDEIFANLPARRKFLKSAAGELRRAAAVLREYAICRPEVAFTLEHDGRVVFSTEGSSDRRRTLEQLWGAEPSIQFTDASTSRLKLECWWQPRQGRNDIASFVNGRSVTDPLIKGAVSAAARELTGNWALFFDVEPSLIDVNIHPAKAEIRFRYPGDVFDLLKAAAASLGEHAPLIIEGGRTFSTDGRPRSAAYSTGSSTMAAAPRGWNFSDTEESKGGSVEGAGHYNKYDKRTGFKSGSASQPYTGASAVKPDSYFNRISTPEFNHPLEPENEEIFQAAALPNLPDVSYLGQTTDGYLVFDVRDGLVLMDPHAAHERVGYERISSAARSSERGQALLISQPLPPTLSLEAEEYREELEKAGFGFKSVDGGIHISSVPLLGPVNILPEALLRASLAVLKDGRESDTTELLWRTWATMACKEAVKLTTRLTPEEALALWRDLYACEQPFFCPHGRPTTLKLESSKLLGHFGRES